MLILQCSMLGEWQESAVLTCLLCSWRLMHKNDRAITSHLSIVQLALDVDLALCDVARQIRDGMRDIIVGHRQNRKLCDRALAACDASCSLVDGRQIGVHVTCGCVFVCV